MNNLLEYKVYIHSDDSKHSQIEQVILSFFEESSERNTLLQSFEVYNLDQSSKIKGYKIKYTEEQLMQFKQKFSHIGLFQFDDYFEYVGEHFHPSYTLDNIYHEGIAKKYENTWNVYYAEGPLIKGDEYKEILLFNIDVTNTQQSNIYDLVNDKFKNWIKDNI